MIKRAAILLTLGLTLAACSCFAGEDATPPRHDFPNVGPYMVLSGDFHMHTINSDGKVTTRQRVEESYALGYDVIAITDHGKTRAYRAANEIGSKLGLVVLRGVETGIEANEHMNALGFDSSYVPKNPHHWSKKPDGPTVYYQDEERAIAKCGGIIIYNHPHCGFNATTNISAEQGLIQGIEVKNDVVSNLLKSDKWKTTNFHGDYCYPNAFDYALKHNLTIFANTDAHGARIENPAKTLVLATARTPEAVMDAFRTHRTVAWFGGMLWGREALLSDMMRASVKIACDKNAVAMENLSPVLLKGTIEGTPGKSFELPAYGKTSVDRTGTDASIIRWDNVWTSSTTNLKTNM